jgi:hypothetical protein
MRKADPLAVDLQDACRDGLREASCGPNGVPHRGGHGNDCGVRKRASQQQRLACLRCEPAQPFRDQDSEVGRNREGIGRRGLGAPALQSPGHLQAHHGVPAGCMVQPGERRPRQRAAQLSLDDPLHDADTERTHHEPLTRQSQVRRDITVGFRAARRDQPDRLAVQPPERKGENSAGAGVQPLDVVDSKQERPRSGERPKHSEHGDPHDPAARLTAAVTGNEQSSRQRFLLDSRQSRQLRWVQSIEEITETSEGQGRIRLTASAGQHCDSGGLGVRQGTHPDRGLAYAGLAGHGQ